MPLVSKTFSQIITFTRASTATYFDATGTLQSAAIDAPRFDYDPDTLAARGFLIEEQRTNSQLYSEDLSNAGGWTTSLATISTNAIAAPTGAVTADKLVEDSSTGQHQVASINSVTAGTAYTFSFFAKPAERTKLVISGMGLAGAGLIATFTLSGLGSVVGGPTGTTITAINNGWYRCVIPYTPTNTTPPIYILDDGSGSSYTGDGTSGLYIWGAQIEVGDFPTSYIPTTTTALTRSADVASVNTLSPWFNAAEGTIYTETVLSRQAAIALTLAATLNDTTLTNALNIFYRATGNTGFQSVVSSVAQADLNNGVAITANTVAKIASAYKVNDFAMSTNSGTVQTDTSGSVPSVTQLQLGQGVPGPSLNGHLRRVTYYPRRLSNAELQGLTA